MSDLLIINPSGAHGIAGGHAIYGGLGDELIALEPPLWPRLIAGYARDRGFSVKIIDAEAERLDPKQIAARILHDVPRLICIAVFGHQPSASTQQMHGARLAAQMCKNYAPNIPIIMVGGHVAALPERTLREEPIDYACNGEGPFTLWALLDGGVPLNHVRGLVWRDKDGSIKNNPPADLIEMRKLHGNAWDLLLPLSTYRAHNWQCFGGWPRSPYAAIFTSLGCPYHCSFCCIQSPFSPEINGNRYRMRDPADVVAEIKMLYDTQGVRTYKFVDEMWLLNKRHVTAICNGIIEAGIGEHINCWAYSRIDTTHAGYLSLLRRAGIRWLALGIESGSKHVRDGAEKALKNDDIVGVCNAIDKAGINIIANYIFGLSDDSMDTMQDTLDLAIMLNTPFANFYCAMAYPGSALYADAVATGKILPSSWRGYSQHNDDCRPLDTEHVSAADVLAFRDNAFRAYFSRPSYLAMMRERFGAATVGEIEKMLTYRLKRKLLEPA